MKASITYKVKLIIKVKHFNIIKTFFLVRSKIKGQSDTIKVTSLFLMGTANILVSFNIIGIFLIKKSQAITTLTVVQV